jgi:hypothetical protein
VSGVVSDPRHPPGEPECTDSWFVCTWHAITGEAKATDDVHIDGITSECLAQVSGSFIYQRHDDRVVPPRLDSLLLYRPKNEHLWVIQPGRVAFASCFESTAAYLHSAQDVCADSPGHCQGGWRQAAPDGTWRDVNATVVVVHDCAVGEAAEGDMCCGVRCAPGRELCKNEFHAGSWAGACSNGTAHNSTLMF